MRGTIFSTESIGTKKPEEAKTGPEKSSVNEAFYGGFFLMYYTNLQFFLLFLIYAWLYWENVSERTCCLFWFLDSAHGERPHQPIRKYLTKTLRGQQAQAGMKRGWSCHLFRSVVNQYWSRSPLTFPVVYCHLYWERLQTFPIAIWGHYIHRFLRSFFQLARKGCVFLVFFGLMAHSSSCTVRFCVA